MNDKKKIIAAVIVLLVVAAAGSYSFMANQQAAAEYGQENFQSCKKIASVLEELKQKPKFAAGHEHRTDETTSLIENAAKSSGIASASIQRIVPKPARKIADTSYKEKPTEVTLRNITLRQLTTMARNLCSNEKNLNIKSIKLTSPNAKDTGDKWNVELVVSYLIYDPGNDNK